MEKKNKLNWLAGAILNYLFNEWLTHLPAHFIRIGFLRLFNKRIHRSATILMHTRILNFWKLEIAERSIVNQHCLLDCRRYPIKISHDVDIGPYTRIWTLAHDPDSGTHTLNGGTVVIGHHTWIASGVTILPGISIASGSVAAANALVVRSTEPMDIVAGVPAKVVRKRCNSLSYRIDYTVFLE